MDNHIVRKPWGYEYIAYQNNDVALKVLHIAHGERTSLHCHPSKSTGLVVLSGTAEINFIADSKYLTAPAKQMIRRGLFHQTHAVSDGGVIMFEIETPVDKDDLVRLRDNYGRENQGYEGSQHELPKDDECLRITDPSSSDSNFYKLGVCDIEITNAVDASVFDNRDPADIVMFLRGGLVKSVSGREHLVTQPGDVGQVSIVKQVAEEMEGFADNTTVVFIK
jgi:mannose-6-phosphate isomerase-like protein (cupin superfamily)